MVLGDLNPQVFAAGLLPGILLLFVSWWLRHQKYCPGCGREARDRCVCK